MSERLALLVLSVCGLAVGCRAPVTSDETLVFVLAGQSNMAGVGYTDELTAPERWLPDGVRFILDGRETTFAAQERFGPEVGFVHGLAAARPGQPVVVIKLAVGGTSLLAWAPNWDATRAALTDNADAGPLYQRLLEVVREASLPSEARIAAILWMQGERDARVPEVAAQYAANLETLIASLRLDLRAREAPFLLGHVNPPVDRYPAARVVRAAQRRAARRLSGVTLVSTDGVSKHADNLHYDTTGQIELGRRFARAYLDLAVAGS